MRILLDAGLTWPADPSAGNELEDHMRRYGFLIIVTLIVVGRPLMAQDDSLAAAGDRVRVTVGADSTPVEGRLEGVRERSGHRR